VRSKTSDAKLIEFKTDKKDVDTLVKNNTAEVPVIKDTKKETNIPTEQENNRNSGRMMSTPLKEQNPQEAYSPSSDMVSSSNSLQTPQLKNEPKQNPRTKEIDSKSAKKQNKKAPKKKRRARQAHVAAMTDSESEDGERMKLPLTQFETVLRRRAIRKSGKDEAVQTASRSPSNRTIFGPSRRTKAVTQPHVDIVEGYDEEVGDTSLGMKLNILGGKVFVQSVIPLSDGRASPAQLTGLIRKGDILLAIDDYSLTNLSLDLLVLGLKPLSSPDESGAYRRTLKLRFSTACNTRNPTKGNINSDEKSETSVDVFSLTQFLPSEIPMADQLSGIPMFDDGFTQKNKAEIVLSNPRVSKSCDNEILGPPVKESRKKSLSHNELLSLSIADMLNDEKQRYTSEFFAWNDSYSELLRPSILATVKIANEISALLERKEMISRGRDAIVGAKKVSYNLEDVDKGNDLRSFKSWNSNISLRSRASTRRKFILDSSSIIGSTIVEENMSDANASIGSESLEDIEEFDGDELLLHLAAHDEIWRRQVLEAIDKEIMEMEEEEERDLDKSKSSDDHDFDIAEKLGSLFLGQEVSKMLSKKKKSYALPPEEITTVLFDLVTHLAFTTPDEISVKGKFELNPQTSLVPFQRLKSTTATKEAYVATLFIVDEVFPKFLRSFKPLPWKERRVLWPYTRASMYESQADGSLGDDMLTVDSAGTFSSATKKKNLRETIEDMELDINARAEACFLVTFYFTQEILPGMLHNALVVKGASKKTFSEGDALDFIESYGAYLKLPMSLAYATFLESTSIVKKLLELAEYDPRHKEARKEISKVQTLVLYEPTMLSAILQLLLTIDEQQLEGRNHLINLSVSAYPDLRPWVVRKGCLETIGYSKDLEELYYLYLSLILHPSDGHETARQDIKLVKEWCELSVKGEISNNTYSRSKVENFLLVASRNYSDHKMYNRDLPFLLELAMKKNQLKVACELIYDIVENKNLVSNGALMSTIRDNLRKISHGSLPAGDTKPMNAGYLKMVFNLLEKLALAEKSLGIENTSNVPDAYFSLISECKDDSKIIFLSLLASEAGPHFTLLSLQRLMQSSQTDFNVLPILQVTLKRSAMLCNRDEISSALFRIRKSRPYQVETIDPKPENLWRKMMSGALTIEK